MTYESISIGLKEWINLQDKYCESFISYYVFVQLIFRMKITRERARLTLSDQVYLVYRKRSTHEMKVFI